MPRPNDAEMGPANSLHALVLYAESMIKDLIDFMVRVKLLIVIG